MNLTEADMYALKVRRKLEAGASTEKVVRLLYKDAEKGNLRALYFIAEVLGELPACRETQRILDKW